MAEYKVNLIGMDGHFIRSIEFLCPDDESAKKCAKKLVVAHNLELWQGDRQVERFAQE